MTVEELQRELGVTTDGKFGPASKAALWAGIKAGKETVFTALASYVARRPVSASLGIAMAQHLPTYGITENGKRLANFLGQAAHESGGFRYLREIWGPTPAQKRYEGRRDLGNVYPGDGFRYMGRGIFQITGRANYDAMGDKLGIDLAENPTLAETPDIAVLTACEYWKSRRLSDEADAGREDAITRKINGGTNGIEDRRAYVARAKAVLL